MLAGAHEQFRVQSRGQILQLQTHRARREIHLSGGNGHARGIHDREEDFELTNVHGLYDCSAVTSAAE